MRESFACQPKNPWYLFNTWYTSVPIVAKAFHTYRRARKTIHHYWSRAHFLIGTLAAQHALVNRYIDFGRTSWLRFFPRIFLFINTIAQYVWLLVAGKP